MELIYAGIGIIIVLMLVLLILLYKVKSSEKGNDLAAIKYKTENLSTEINRIELSVRNEIANNRVEANEAARNARNELSESLGSFEEKLNTLTSVIESRLRQVSENYTLNSKDSRKELKESLESFKNDFSASVKDFTTSQRDNFYALLNKQDEHNKSTIAGLGLMRETLEKKMSEIQSGNEKKLEEMRSTVDEKLQKTLETRLGESFKLVSERLEAVHKGLGDMQQLAIGVGDLKKVLSNVKTRGVLGEYQLENILEQTLTADQFAKNVKTKQGSNALVEFAVRLPGREDKTVWLPVDSKFPKEDFELLMDAYEHGTAEQIEDRRRTFIRGIKKCAADICGKYIDPPNTTDFAILFLPFESLYAEVLRTPGLFETIRKECRINIAGPTTLSAFLSSLQMGFRTLAIEKRSGEVWQLLSAVKTEFGVFGGILEKTQKKLQEASNVIDQASVRSRAIEKKLVSVQDLPKEVTMELLDNIIENVASTEIPGKQD